MTRGRRTTTQRAAPLAAAAAVALASLAGCYSHDGLVTAARNKAIRTRIDEVDLGSYRVTLPRDVETGQMIEIDVRIFGESERYKLNEIRDQLKERRAVVADVATRTLRESPDGDLVEPELTSLRARMLAAFNASLDDAPLKSVGFHDIRLIRH